MINYDDGNYMKIKQLQIKLNIQYIVPCLSDYRPCFFSFNSPNPLIHGSIKTY